MHIPEECVSVTVYLALNSYFTYKHHQFLQDATLLGEQTFMAFIPAVGTVVCYKVVGINLLVEKLHEIVIMMG